MHYNSYPLHTVKSEFDNQETSPKTVSPHKAYLVGLDSLRGMAALMVCLYHFTNGTLPKIIVPSAKRLFSHGNLGVEAFFVLSGFIIPYSLVGKNHHSSRIYRYLSKRILRINPPAYAAIFLTIGQAFFVDKVIQHSNKYTHGITWSWVLDNLLFTVPFTDSKWIVGVLWTLAIEFQFYIFIGILFTFLFERKKNWLFVCVYLLAAGSYYLFPIVDSFLQYSSLFALGGIALLWQQRRINKLAYSGLLILFTGLLYWQINVYVAIAGLLTALALNLLRMQLPGLGFLGKISYSFYLLHILIGTSCEFFLVKFIPPTSAGNKLLIMTIAIVLAIVGSYIFYILVERPAIRLASKQR